MSTHIHRHSYKEIRLQQLRSFCETARLGSLSAAAASLGLSQPTICEQVHALERFFDDKLIQRYAHGSQLTETGRLLAELAAPLVAGVDSLPSRVRETQGRVETWLTIAATQRTLVEELPQVTAEFERREPLVHLRFLELGTEAMIAAVEAGDADMGLSSNRNRMVDQHPWLVFDPAYELDVFLITPKDHPLARRRHVRPRDLLDYPLINSPQGMPDPTLKAALDKLGIFRTGPRRVEAVYTTVIRRYVELGYGIGLVLGIPGHKSPSRRLHERSMSRFFGRVTLYLVSRKGVTTASHQAFAQVIRGVRNSGAQTSR